MESLSLRHVIVPGDRVWMLLGAWDIDGAADHAASANLRCCLCTLAASVALYCCSTVQCGRWTQCCSSGAAQAIQAFTGCARLVFLPPADAPQLLSKEDLLQAFPAAAGCRSRQYLHRRAVWVDGSVLTSACSCKQVALQASCFLCCN